jgi:predicted RND superfamily exporter protein
MTTKLEQRLVRVFGRIVAWRWPVVAFYAALLPIAALLAVDVPRDTSLENMVASSDAGVVETRRFHELYPEPETVSVMLETEAPFTEAALGGLEEVQGDLAAIDGVAAFSIATIWDRSRPGSGRPSDDPDEVRRVVTGTDFFRRQGLYGERFLGVVLALDESDPEPRDRLLNEIDRVLAPVPDAIPVFRRVRQVGRPLIDSWLERETSASTARFMPLFGVFVVTLVLGLFRSWRALVVILVSLAAAVALGLAFAAIVGLKYTIVSALVPLTLMVTTTASLVYLHSRFVDQPLGVDLEIHRLQALANKWVAVTASVFAASVGFAALAVSSIRPIRELGIWTAGGLMLGWLVCFTLYPALQVILRPPTRRQRQVAGAWVIRAAAVIPAWSYRWRWPLVVSASLLAGAGLIALFGIPGVLPGMPLETDSLAYIDSTAGVAQDTRLFESQVLGLTNAKVWVTVPDASVLEPEALRAMDRFSRELERQPVVGSVVGLPSILRLRRYLAGLGDELPDRPAELARLAAEVEQLALTEPSVAQWIDLDSLGSTYLTVTGAAGTQAGLDELAAAVDIAWTSAAAAEPVMAGYSFRLAGMAVLQATISSHLVPTLTESFAITFAVIFGTFVVVFRSGPARLNAMVPSLFAILVTFLVMRVTGIPLNVATILIATTVLGATENDQIHFFYHFLEARDGGSTERALSHSIRVAGHAIVFATVINAGGFLALALSDLPPMRQFGVVTSMAFALAMLADFTALPAALWIFFKERPAEASAGSRMEGGKGEGRTA